MRFYPRDRDHEPLGHLGRVPVFVTTIIAALYCVGMLVTVMLATANGPVATLEFSPGMFYRHGWLWQMFTCTFVNSPSFFFLFGIFCFYRFSLDVEQFFGRRTYLKFYALTLLVPPLVLGAWYAVGVAVTYAGLYETLVGMFLALATLYPNVEYFGWVPIKYIAFACLAIAALAYFPEHNWPGLTVLLAQSGLAFGFIRYVKLGGSVEFGDLAHKLNPFRRRPKFRVLPSPAASRVRPAGGSVGSIESVDAILDKIAQRGFASLTQDERDQLEKAREILNKKKG